MKKAKIMLLTIAVLAAAGAALAFKVKKFGSNKYCYAITTTQPANADCNRIVKDRHANALTLGTKIYYTTTTDLNNCGDFACTSIAELPLAG